MKRSISKELFAVFWFPAVLFTLVAIAYVGWNYSRGSRSGPCIKYAKIEPLLVGASTEMRVGGTAASDCDSYVDRSEGWHWSSDDMEIVRVDSDGKVYGVQPGNFRITASKGEIVLHAHGFVLPPDYSVQIEPKVVKVRPGESFELMVRALDAKGRRLPIVPFSLLTEDWLNLVATPDPMYKPWIHLAISKPGEFKALRPGTKRIDGEIGKRTASATISVVISNGS